MKRISMIVVLFMVTMMCAPFTGFAQYADQAPFDGSELSKFMSDYPDFVSWAREAGEMYGSIEDPNVVQSMALSESLQSYVSSLGWDTERFFYMMTHVASGLSAVMMEEAGVDMAAQMAAMQNKTAFEAYKIYQTGEAVVTGIAAAVKAWDAGMSTGGPHAPIVAAAYAASSLAWTAAQVAAIQSAKFGGGAASASSGTVGTYNANPATGVYEQEAAGNRGTLTINIHGDFVGDESFIDNLVDKINDAEDRDVVINTSRSLAA